MRINSFAFVTALCFFSFFNYSCSQTQTKTRGEAIPLKTQLVAKGLVSPIGMAVANDGSNRLFVIEQSGKIRIIKNGVLLPKPFLNLSKKLDNLSIGYSEKGLLGLAFHPDFKNNKKFYVYYSAPYQEPLYDHISVLSEFSASAGNPDSALIGSERIIMTIPEPESNHNGGCLAFGKDGMLYLGPGDGGGAGDQHGNMGNGQDLNTLLGKILRIDIDGKTPYEIPSDNPFIGKDAKPEIWAYGLRNPWRFSFDRESGKLFCGDVGQNKYEEIDIIEKGKNYGWRVMEGYHCYDPQDNCKQDNLALPIFEYPHSYGVSVTGGYVYRGKQIPAIQGCYVAGDWNGKLFILKQSKDWSWNKIDITLNGEGSEETGAKINSFGEDENGEIYIITQSFSGPRSHTGVVYRLVR